MWSTRLLNRLRRWWLEVPPEWLLVLSFCALILAGTAGLLWLPGLYVGRGLTPVEALFTATSAACVTGLAVVDTATHFTRLGQAWVLLLIQLGGLGLIGITSSIIGAMGRRLSLRTEMLVVPSLGEGEGGKARRQFGVRIVLFTLGVEAGCAVILWGLWIPQFGVGEALWHAVFHAVSAFCNAGFSTFSDSLMGQAAHPAVLSVIAIAILLGSFGYLSTAELWQWWRRRGTAPVKRLSVHTWAALVVTLALLVGGALGYGLLERRGTLTSHGPVDAAMNAVFMSVTARTAGFNSVDYAQLGNGAVLLTLFLMGVGGSPGSTAGGIKTTALAILIALAVARIRGRRAVQLHDRSVPDGTVQRTVSLVLLFLLVLALANATLTLSETGGMGLDEARRAFLPLLFETVSAVATVGLSMNVTYGLSEWGQLTLCLAMFIGRVGPLSFFVLISVRTAHAGLRSAAEDVIVG